VSRYAKVERATKESSVRVELELDGTGRAEVETGVPFFDHMVNQLGKHGGFDLVVRTVGDLEVDAHHTVEDTSIALGQALREALGDKAGIRRFGDALVPLDETLVQAAVDLSGRPRLVVTRTMSKAFAFAAARLGYLAADPSVVQALQLLRLPYHLSVQTQAAARAALARADELLASVAAGVEQRDRLLHEIAELGLEVVPSDANFVLFGEFGDQQATWQGLLDRGVLVRDVGLAGWLRVTAGTEAETTAFLDALREGLSTTETSEEVDA
jgi:histidinol-phosphate aminotransferase